MKRTSLLFILLICACVACTPQHAQAFSFPPTADDAFGTALKEFVAPLVAAFSGTRHAAAEDFVAARSLASAGQLRCAAIAAPQQRYDCYQNAAQGLLDRFSFHDINLALDGATFDCHDLMHSIAARAYAQSGSLAKVYQDATFACYGAAYHGGAEGYLLAHGQKGASQQDLEATILSGCRDALSESSPLYFQCVHGIGHALMFVLADELPAALQLCDSFTDEGERVNCYGGAFMENVPSSQLSPHVSRYVRKDDIYYPCTILSAHFQATCYHFQFSRIFDPQQQKPNAIAAFCMGIPSKFKDQCYKDAGLTAASMYTAPSDRVHSCETLGEGPHTASCIRGVVRFYLDRYAGVPDKLAGAFDFCAAVPEQYKHACYVETGEVMAGRIRSMNQQESIGTAKTICAQAGGYQDACVEGIFAKQIAI